MEPRDLNRMFDRLSPSPEQERAVWDRLLHEERKVRPMKKLKKLTVVAVAAALMVMACAAAVVTGIDQRLADYFGANPEQVELLTPGAVPVDIIVEDNGATFHVTQVLMDRYSILILADFTAPEGTVLDMKGNEQAYYGDHPFCFLDENGNQIPAEWLSGGSIKYQVLEDKDPLDNRMTLLFCIMLSGGIQPEWNAAFYHLSVENISYFDSEQWDVALVYSGDWSCDIPLPKQDMGQCYELDILAGQLDGVNITAKEVYLSPMNLHITLEREVPLADEVLDEEAERIYSRWVSALNIARVTLTDRDGQEIPLEHIGGEIGDQEHHSTFRLTQITALDQLKGGTLTLRIGDGSVDIPLDNLTSMG